METGRGVSRIVPDFRKSGVNSIRWKTPCLVRSNLNSYTSIHWGEEDLVAPFPQTSLIWTLLLEYLLFDDKLNALQLLGVLTILSGLLLAMFTIEKPTPNQGRAK